jgi:hypothetical protein
VSAGLVRSILPPFLAIGQATIHAINTLIYHPTQLKKRLTFLAVFNK